MPPSGVFDLPAHLRLTVDRAAFALGMDAGATAVARHIQHMRTRSEPSSFEEAGQDMVVIGNLAVLLRELSDGLDSWRSTAQEIIDAELSHHHHEGTPGHS